MEYIEKHEFYLSSFEFWSGAKSIIDDACTLSQQGAFNELTAYDYVLDVISTLIEQALEGADEVSATDINDYVWFDLEDSLDSWLGAFDSRDDLCEHGDLEDKAAYLLISIVFKRLDSSIWEA